MGKKKNKERKERVAEIDKARKHTKTFKRKLVSKKKHKERIKLKRDSTHYPVQLSDTLKEALEVVNTHEWNAQPNEHTRHTSYSDQIMAAALLVSGGVIRQATKATGITYAAFKYRLMQSAFVREVADTAKLSLIDTAEGHLASMVEDGKLSAKNRNYRLDLTATEWKDMIWKVLRTKGGYLTPQEQAEAPLGHGMTNIQVIVQNIPEHPHVIVQQESEITDPQELGNYIHYDLANEKNDGTKESSD